LEAKDALGDENKILEVLSQYEEVLPKSNTHVRLAVDLLPAGPSFKEKLEKFIRPLIIKGVPSLINDMKQLYKDSGKATILGELLSSMNTSMQESMKLDSKDEEEQDPTVQLWLYYYNSQHQYRMGNVEEALTFINKGIEHTPTVIELYVHKAKIMQFAGNRQLASDLVDMSRDLDQADRYLNALASKYLFKVDNVKQAYDTMAMFSKEDKDGYLNVHDMQTMWFEDHCGSAQLRKGDLRKALHQFWYIQRHIETMADDIYDFHYYSYRKVTVNHYLQMLDLQDQLFKGKYPVIGCVKILKVLQKIAKSGETVETVKQAHEDYKATDEYKKWLKDNEGEDEEDMPLTDPEGWDLYTKAAEAPFEYMLDFAKNVA
jgi:N-alpha-acetyltransferase 15/16, NatA auxiliary subunit